MPISKFSIANLATVMVSMSVFLEGAIWLRESQVLDSTNYLPVFFPFPIDSVFLIGRFASFVGLGLLAAHIFLMIRRSPKPHTAILFLGFLIFGFAIPESATTRHFVVLLATSAASVIECRLRTHSDCWFLMPLTCFSITLCYYLVMVAAMASAAC